MRGSRSPTCGSSSIRSSPSRGALRGKTPSSRPSRQTTRCGTERIGTSVQIVRWPVRKFARVGRPCRRSASSARTSGSASASRSPRRRPSPRATTSSSSALELARAARRRARAVAVERVGGGGDRRRPSASIGCGCASASSAACRRSTSSAKRPARSIAPLSTSSSGSTPPNSRCSSSVIVTPSSTRSRPGAPGAGVERVELERRAVRGVEAPADAARRRPSPRCRARSSSSKPEAAAHRLAVGEVEHLRGGQPLARRGRAARRRRRAPGWSGAASGRRAGRAGRAGATSAGSASLVVVVRPRRRRTSPGSAARTSRCPGT